VAYPNHVLGKGLLVFHCPTYNYTNFHVVGIYNEEKENINFIL
jgi:hypothetical protein